MCVGKGDERIATDEVKDLDPVTQEAAKRAVFQALHSFRRELDGLTNPMNANINYR